MSKIKNDPAAAISYFIILCLFSLLMFVEIILIIIAIIKKIA